MSEDDRTLWCGNLSDKVTEELLYELCLQAGPVDNVTIPRDSEKRQRSFAFVTYVHACSVEYAMRILDGSALFKRVLTLHRKTRSGPNPAASPKENFKYPLPNDRFQGEPARLMQDTSHRITFMANEPLGRTQDPSDHNSVMINGHPANGSDSRSDNNMRNDILSVMAMAMGSGGCTSEMLMQLGQQMLGAELPAFEDNHQNNTYRSKMNHRDRHHRNPYSRDDRYDRNHDRDDTRHRHRHDNDNRRNDRDRDRDRDHRRRR